MLDTANNGITVDTQMTLAQKRPDVPFSTPTVVSITPVDPVCARISPLVPKTEMLIAPITLVSPIMSHHSPATARAGDGRYMKLVDLPVVTTCVLPTFDDTSVEAVVP